MERTACHRPPPRAGRSARDPKAGAPPTRPSARDSRSVSCDPTGSARGGGAVVSSRVIGADAVRSVPHRAPRRLRPARGRAVSPRHPDGGSAGVVPSLVTCTYRARVRASDRPRDRRRQPRPARPRTHSQRRRRGAPYAWASRMAEPRTLQMAPRSSSTSTCCTKTLVAPARVELRTGTRSLLARRAQVWALA